MLKLQSVSLPFSIPIVGFELSPCVELCSPDQSTSNVHVAESAPVYGGFLQYRWYRLESDRKVPAVCSVHPSEVATFQCLDCVRGNIPVTRSYYCTAKCYSDAWPHHGFLHGHAASVASSSGSNTALSGSASSSSLTNSAVYPPIFVKRIGTDSWFEVGRDKMYTPTADDTGHTLAFECTVVNAETKIPVGKVNTITIGFVIPAPSPFPRCMVTVNEVHEGFDGSISSQGKFSVLSYNILADVFASSQIYSNCPPWALSWSFRKQNLLREIVDYHADIVCLQEVQYDHFEDFFAPELDKHGYQALFQRKSNQAYDAYLKKSLSVDGCATFFLKDKFSLVKKHEVDFNRAARKFIDEETSPFMQEINLKLLIKDNVALIAVLEPKFSNQGAKNPGKQQLLCVANTHLNDDLKDVKLWQVHTFLKELEKIANSEEKIPTLVCGDFNSVPGSAPHALLTLGKVTPLHPDFPDNATGILLPYNKFSHQLRLVSAYSSFARRSIGLKKHGRRLDPTTNEPLFTTFTTNFTGTLDYILYTASSLVVESLLELLDEERFGRDTALPSPKCSSDHLALMAEFSHMP